MRAVRPVACAALLLAGSSLPCAPPRPLARLAPVQAAAQGGVLTIHAPAGPVLVDDTVTFQARVRGEPAGTPVQWIVLGRNVDQDSLSVDRRRLRFRSPGRVTVVARLPSGAGDTAVIQVIGIRLSPVRMRVGESRQVTALFDSVGPFTGGVPLAWSVRGLPVARVNPTGLVTGNAAGSTRVRAGFRGAWGEAEVTVESALVVRRGECERPWPPAWIWCDDFERDRLGAYFEYDAAGGRFVRRDSVGHNGSWGMAATFVPGRSAAGSLRVAFGRVPSTRFLPQAASMGWRDSLEVGTDTSRLPHRELWWRFWVRYPADWRGGGGNRLSAAAILADLWKAQAMVAFVWSPSTSPRPGALSIDPATGVDASGTVRTTRYEDFSQLRFRGTSRGATVLASPGDGRWHCVEAHARLNDPGRANALFELFVDGKPEARRDGFDWVRGYSPYGINAVVFDNLWPEGTPRQQTRYLDELVVSTQRIGCGGS